MRLLIGFCALVLGFAENKGEEVPVQGNNEQVPDKGDQEQERVSDWKKRLEILDRDIEKNPKNEGAFSERGDVRFFLGDFPGALEDYEKTVELNPESENSHWRRGICYYYNEQYEKAALQFENYHSFDNVDRENGIWRFLSQVKAEDREKAKMDLLKYEKDDREPFPSVYRLFSEEITPDEVLKKIEQTKLSEEMREQREFYAHLYVGLYLDVEKKPKEALEHLEKAAQNPWGKKAGYGPRYMSEVARLHAEKLRKQLKKEATTKE